MTNTDYTSILRYDRMVLDSKTFSAEEKWSISQERSISMQSEFNPTGFKEKRFSYMSDATRKKCLDIYNRINN